MVEELKIVLDCLEQPAFLAQDGVVCYCNPPALRLQLQPGQPVEQLLGEVSASENYVRSWDFAGQAWSVTVQSLQKLQLYLLRQDHSGAKDTEWLCAATWKLRQPLQQMFLAASKLFPYLEEQEDETIQKGTAALNHSMYQMMHAVGTLSETGTPLGRENDANFRRTEGMDFFGRFAERVQPLVETTGRVLEYTGPDHRFYVSMDEGAVERAVLNLLAEAVRYTPRGKKILLQVLRQKKHCCILLKYEGEQVSPEVLVGLMRTGQDTPLELGGRSVQFGLLMARNVASRHNGAVMVQPNPDGGLWVAMTLALDTSAGAEAPLRTPRMELEYFGGYDRYLTELSDILADSLYDTRNL